MATSTVTLDRAYFETLMRRAQFHTSGVDFTTPVHVPTVTIPKIDHDNLLASAREYANLRQNLYRGGIAEETLAILIKDDAPANEEGTSAILSTVEDTMTENDTILAQTHQSVPSIQGGGYDYTYGRNANYTPRDLRPRNNDAFQNPPHINDDFTYMPDGPSDGLGDGANGNNELQTKFTRQQYDKFAKRTILLANLPDAVTHTDIVDVVRGGMLLDIYLRTNDRTASVSFLEEAHAQEFFRHVKRHDLYIRGKRVEIRWSDRQFILPGHVANKIAMGATRNLVILNRNPKLTEDAIREDLDHIHNLVVIWVKFVGQNTHISTNSVHNAMFARTCMMSRATYKGSKIGWDEDECATPVKTPQKARKESAPLKKKSDAHLVNRFQLLDMDGTDDGSQEGEDHNNSGITFENDISASTVGIGIIS